MRSFAGLGILLVNLRSDSLGQIRPRGCRDRTIRRVSVVPTGAMNAAAVRSFVRGEVAEVESELPDDAIPLWQSSTRLVLATLAGCQPYELQKRSMPNDVRYETIDIAKGYNIRVTPTLMIFVSAMFPIKL
ncbi:hypothetical protein RB9758 [Rhodopirellula baltica SH 1]|uniref:Uncharacterized protein n=2 Tax=Rhodopirellula baltica TaxID=265606 RepID=Q7UL38_RHOBA|nr:hypothetical protein RB9758 [Rhodopirellula baltica SH 1]